MKSSEQLLNRQDTFYNYTKAWDEHIDSYHIKPE